MSNNDLQNKFPRGVEPISTAVIVNREGKILLSKSSKWGDKYNMPGGHIEPCETIEQVALREGLEEVGLKLKSHGIINFGELINSPEFHRPAHFIYFHVLCSIIGDESINLADKELSGFIWVSPEEALKLDLGEGFGLSIKKYIELKNNGHKIY